MNLIDNKALTALKTVVCFTQQFKEKLVGRTPVLLEDVLHRASDIFFIEEDTAAITVKCRRDPLYPTLENVIPGRTVSHLANKIIPSII